MEQYKLTPGEKSLIENYRMLSKVGKQNIKRHIKRQVVQELIDGADEALLLRAMHRIANRLEELPRE